MPSTTPVLLRGPVDVDGGAFLLSHEVGAVPLARRALTGRLREDPHVAPVLDEVAVVVSELLGNAVRHARPIGRGDLLLRWRVDVDAVEVAVEDGGGSGEVALAHAGDDATCGRGMRIVATLARAWGTSQDAHGHRTVWATVALPTPRPA